MCYLCSVFYQHQNYHTLIYYSLIYFRFLELIKLKYPENEEGDGDGERESEHHTLNLYSEL